MLPLRSFIQEKAEMPPLFSKILKGHLRNKRNTQGWGFTFPKIRNILKWWHICAKFGMFEAQTFLVDQKSSSFDKDWWFSELRDYFRKERLPIQASLSALMSSITQTRYEALITLACKEKKYSID